MLFEKQLTENEAVAMYWVSTPKCRGCGVPLLVNSRDGLCGRCREDFKRDIEIERFELGLDKQDKEYLQEQEMHFAREDEF